MVRSSIGRCTKASLLVAIGTCWWHTWDLIQKLSVVIPTLEFERKDCWVFYSEEAGDEIDIWRGTPFPRDYCMRHTISNGRCPVTPSTFNLPRRDQPARCACPSWPALVRGASDDLKASAVQRGRHYASSGPSQARERRLRASLTRLASQGCRLLRMTGRSMPSLGAASPFLEHAGASPRSSPRLRCLQARPRCGHGRGEKWPSIGFLEHHCE